MQSRIQHKQKSRIKLAVVILGVLYFGVVQRANAFDAMQTFTKKCSSCHSVGGGDGVAPDLKDIKSRRSEDWLIKFISSSEAMVSSGDPTAVELFEKFNKKVMPDQDLSVSDIRALLDFIQSGGVVITPMDAKSALDAKPYDIQNGEDYFMGRKPLSGGGVACISCHSVGVLGPLGGGTLAKNLTPAYSAYKDNGLSKALKNIAFPVMQQVYADHPLNDDEIYQIKSFLYKADQAGLSNPGVQKKFVFLGLGGTVLALGGIDFIWRRRRKHAVKNFRGDRS